MSDLEDLKNLDKPVEPIKKNKVFNEIIEWSLCILIAVAIALLFRYFIGTPTRVQGDSMLSTLHDNDRLVLNKLPKTFKTMPEYGDIITFEAPSTPNIELSEANLSNPIAKYENNPTTFFGKFFYYWLDIGKKTYIKRVIGVPGDYIEIKDNKVFVNGNELKEDYLDDGMVTEMAGGVFTNIVVPNKCVFVMGDNRTNSRDSRHFGCVPLEKIEGKILFRFFPFNKFGGI